VRYRSEGIDGFQVWAVTGVHSVSFAITATEAARKGLLGFAVNRDGEPMKGFKIFESIIPHPTKDTEVSTHEHPIQSLVWDDFTAHHGHTHRYEFIPMRGKPGALVAGKAIPIAVTTEKLHDVFFNAGVASSQAYARKFQNAKPDGNEAALLWLSRGLDDAIVRFVDDAKAGDALRCAFYEFHYAKVLDALKRAIDRGVDVKCVVDFKNNASGDPRKANEKAILEAKLPDTSIVKRQARKNVFAHNKFMVLLRGGTTAAEVWTGSTNLTTSAIHGQTNVGHRIRNAAVAERYLAYWKLLADDPGGHEGDAPSDVKKKNAAFYADVAALTALPTKVEDIPHGITPVFSPRASLDPLKLYVSLLDSATSSAHVTFAFGVPQVFTDALKDNDAASHISFLLLEKKDVKSGLRASNNVYEAWGSYIEDDLLYRWTKETNAFEMGLAKNVGYVHTKFLLRDPLGADPIVVTGSANFSEDSTKDGNDENMVIIRGDARTADIYFTEFNRLFSHYYFRAVHEATNGKDFSVFLAEDDAWLASYAPGKLRQKRVDMFSSMAGAQPG
jgi:hypothetical protein